MSIKITRQGLLATIQDRGRFGYRSLGIGCSGAMDPFALLAANYLAGNDDAHALIEMNFPAPEMVFQQDAWISLTGADFTATINERSVPLWSALPVKKDDVLKCLKPVQGTKLYLAVQGGWKADKWLNSFSTHLKAGAGGYAGRALQQGDIISFPANKDLNTEKSFVKRSISPVQLNRIYQPSQSIRCIMGPQWDWLDPSSKQHFVNNDFVVSHQSDRMGYRLSGPSLYLSETIQLISSPVDTGTIQLLPDGNTIILMADHQTTGGYPAIASVIKADLPKLAQAKPGQPINFNLVSWKDAEESFFEMHQVLKDILNPFPMNR
jgi:antagonist of KipI